MNRGYIYLKDLIKDKLRDDYLPQIILGKDRKGDLITKELDNLLISGHTHSGKSMFLDSLIYTLLNRFSPEELELVLIDIKCVEFKVYEGIKYLRGKVNQNIDDSINALEDCILEIERRKRENVRGKSIVILIDEFADLVIGDPRSEELISEIAKEGKEVGIYIILSSSMASERVYTEKIKRSIPKRLIGSVSSKENSLLLLDEEGAEELLGNGDMIFKDMDTKEKIRVQTPYISTEDIEKILDRVIEDREIDRIYRLKDVLYEDAKRVVIESGNATASYLQRYFKIGYNQASRLIEQLELNEVIGPKDGSKKREVLIDEYEESIDKKEEINIEDGGDKSKGGIMWLTTEQFNNALHIDKEFPIKEIKLIPFLVQDVHKPDFSIVALITGVLKVYDWKKSDMLKSVYDVDISKQKQWYKDLLLLFVHTEPKEEVLEMSILNILFSLRQEYGNEYVLPLWKNTIVLLPTSKIFCDYISTMIEYLYDNPKERSEKTYKEIQGIFKKIKKEEVEPRIWESMVLTNYCLTDLLGNDKSKALYLSDIKQENLVKAIKERSCFDILFGEEYI